MSNENTIIRSVHLWLIIGLFFVLGQVVIGGVTRLTGSGLSITKWEIVTGTLPPLNIERWEEAFKLYQETPQYKLINKGMSLSEFKEIYFWEYLHRLWARIMGLVFLFPFLFFLYKGWINPPLKRRLFILVFLAALAASFGWIMVASGLNERPWVNAYKLGVHLLLGFLVFAYLFYIWYDYAYGSSSKVDERRLRVWSNGLLGLVTFQVFLGGMVSGMKAGFSYPTWPSMNGEWIPDLLLDKSQWNINALVVYDSTSMMPALSQFLHRGLAYLLILLGGIFVLKLLKSHQRLLHTYGYGFILVLLIQVSLGVITVLHFKQGLPVLWASMHQIGGLFLFTYIFHLRFNILAARFTK